MEVDTDDSILSCQELVTFVECAENIPKAVHIVAYKSISDLRNDFKDEASTIKTILSLPQLSPAREIVNNLIKENESLAYMCLDNSTLIDSLRESITQIDRHSDKLSNKLAQVQKTLANVDFDDYYNQYVNEVDHELKSLKSAVLKKRIQFDEYFKTYEMLKSELLTQEILKQIYSKK